MSSLTANSKVNMNLFQCTLCPEIFNNSYLYIEHLKQHSSPTKDNPPNNGLTMKPATVDNPFECPYCKKPFSYFSKLNEHIRSHTGEKPFKCIICGKTFSQSGSLNKHRRTHCRQKRFQCQFCPERFIRYDSLTRHLKTHMEKKLFECQKCLTLFPNSEKLQAHLKSHKKTELFRCHYCKVTFLHSDSLTKHLRVHTDKGNLVCQFCDKDFFYPSKFNEHLRIHTGEKPYQCIHCGKKFSQSGSLTKHIRTHFASAKTFPTGYLRPQNYLHIEPLVSPPEQQQQQQQTLSSQARGCEPLLHTGLYQELKLPLNFETKTTPPAFNAAEAFNTFNVGQQLQALGLTQLFHCKYCPASFPHVVTLARHLKLHTQAKVYRCPYCQKIFLYHSKLNEHVRSHTGEKPFTCVHCYKSFSQSGSLTKHLRIHKNRKLLLNFPSANSGMTTNTENSFNVDARRKVSIFNDSSAIESTSNEIKTNISNDNVDVSEFGLTADSDMININNMTNILNNDVINKNISNNNSSIDDIKVLQMNIENDIAIDTKHDVMASETGLVKKIKTENCVDGDVFRKEMKEAVKSEENVKEKLTFSELDANHVSQTINSNGEIANALNIKKELPEVTNCDQLSCTYCKAAFSHVSAYTQHLKLHNQRELLECEYCKKQFLYFSKLNEHLRSHTGQKPFHCTYCNKSYTQQGSLTKHIRTHNLAEPYQELAGMKMNITKYM